jgi:hypothetical protein
VRKYPRAHEASPIGHLLSRPRPTGRRNNRLWRANILTARSRDQDYRAIHSEEIARAASGVNIADAEGVVGKMDAFVHGNSHWVLSAGGANEGCCHTAGLWVLTSCRVDWCSAGQLAGCEEGQGDSGEDGGAEHIDRVGGRDGRK